MYTNTHAKDIDCKANKNTTWGEKKQCHVIKWRVVHPIMAGKAQFLRQVLLEIPSNSFETETFMKQNIVFLPKKFKKLLLFL